MAVVCAVVAFIIILNTVIIPNQKYNEAMVLLAEGRYEDAVNAFELLGGYRDSEERKRFAYSRYISEKLNDPQVGDYLKFGLYEQDGNVSNGREPVEWLVLDKQDGNLLLISKYALDSKQYNENYQEVNWEKCTLREWLNDDFLNGTFTSDDISLIPTVTVTAGENHESYTHTANDTEDKVFLLSVEEVNRYFTTSEERACKPTRYAVKNGAFESGNGDCWWVLRTPGNDPGNVADVRSDGIVRENGGTVDRFDTAVRPVLWLCLSS